MVLSSLAVIFETQLTVVYVVSGLNILTVDNFFFPKSQLSKSLGSISSEVTSSGVVTIDLICECEGEVVDG
jgi:hypothetical protein